jgi:hypothetical protein
MTHVRTHPGNYIDKHIGVVLWQLWQKCDHQSVNELNVDERTADIQRS